MQLFSAIFQVWQGYKQHTFNAGAAIALLAFALLKGLSKFGMTPDQATSDATYIIGAIGVIISIVGMIHQLVITKKANAIKKAAGATK